MTNLERITAKIFGETATATGDDPQIGQFGSALAGTYVGTTNVDTIQSLPAWSNGFIDSVTPNEQFPPLPEMTGFGKVLSHQIAYTLQKGIPEWDSGTTYYEGDFAKGIGEGKLYVSKVDSNINNALTNSTYWEEFSSGTTRNIGEIVTSTMPLTDAGLHLLDGTKLPYSGIYTAFIDAVVAKYSEFTNAWIDEATWQATVAQYGACGKFVFDTNDYSLRIPKITGFIEGGIVNNLGNLTPAGLPNITGSVTGPSGTTATGAFTVNPVARLSGGESVNIREGSMAFNASLSNAIYGRSNTVQPQSVKVLYYIVIATSTKTDVQVDIDEIATDLNGKADVDLTNINASGTSLGAKWAMPSSTYEDLTLGASGATYTAPANGWVQATTTNTAATNHYIYLGANYAMGNAGITISVLTPLHKGQQFNFTYINNTINIFRFYYAEGSKGEA